MTSTQDPQYTRHLAGQTVWWKRLLDVQRPYRNHLRGLKPGRFLEVGCGIGRNLFNARGFAEGLGIDHNAASVEAARARGLDAMSTEAFLASDRAVPGSFDTLLVSHVLEHLTPTEALALLRAHLSLVRPGGQVIVVTPQECGFASDPTHVHFFDFAECASLLTAAGITDLRQRSFPFPRWAGRWFTYNEFVTVGRVSRPG
jgi:2-polyprenyl-3-methyl-5-hydroxy-6-metoxy-1,4-benzoquinol methylase